MLDVKLCKKSPWYRTLKNLKNCTAGTAAADLWRSLRDRRGFQQAGLPTIQVHTRVQQRPTVDNTMLTNCVQKHEDIKKNACKNAIEDILGVKRSSNIE